jgi:16S rRNA processing protein RimM
MVEKPSYLLIGKLLRPFGLHGEITMEVFTDFPERIRKGMVVYLGEDYIPSIVISKRKHGKGLLVAFENYSDLESAASLRNQWVYVSARDRPKLPDNGYYHHDLIGLKVYTDQEIFLGEIHEILVTGANDVYVVRHENGNEVLIPAIPQTVKNIELVNNRMIISLLPGLLPES